MNIKRISLLVVLLALGIVLAACSSGGDSSSEVADLEAQVADLEAQLEEAKSMAEGSADSGEAAQTVTEGGKDTLKVVRDRGTLKCGGNQSVPGFGYINPDNNEFEGFDIDFCKAIAAAVLGDATQFEIRPTTANERFPVLQSGEIDVLIRNTTWTLSRDTQLGADFQPTTFYDGQYDPAKIAALPILKVLMVVLSVFSPVLLLSVTDVRARGINFTPVVFDDAPKTLAAYDSGQCDGFTTDKSGLVSQQILLAEPDAHVILEESMSKEPLGPLTLHGDNNWGDIVMWTVNCTIQAEELGITSENVDEMLGSEDPVVQNVLGVTGDLGLFMGLDADWCYQVIKQVGNYEEIYNRSLGPDTPFNLERGQNSLYTEGGLLYSPPFR